MRNTPLPDYNSYDFRVNTRLGKDRLPTITTTDTQNSTLFNLHTTITDAKLNKAIMEQTLAAAKRSSSLRGRKTNSYYGGKYYQSGYYNPLVGDLDSSHSAERNPEAFLLRSRHTDQASILDTPDVHRLLKTDHIMAGLSDDVPSGNHVTTWAKRVPEIPRNSSPSSGASLLTPGTLRSRAHQFWAQAEVRRMHTGSYDYNASTNESCWSCCGNYSRSDPGCKVVTYNSHRTNYGMTPNRILD